MEELRRADAAPGIFARIDLKEIDMYSTKGNPRRVTDEQVERILEWHANRKSLKEFAKEINLPPSTINSVIYSGGRYKQPSPEKRAAVLDFARAERKRLRAAGWL